MSRNYNIKWSQNDYERLKKATRNAKDKARRMAKSNPGVSLPDIPTFAQLKATISTRNEFNKALNQLQSFSHRGGEQRMSTNIGRLEQNQVATLQKELNRVAAQFNAKVDSLSKRYEGQNVLIPEKIDPGTYADKDGNSYLVKAKDLRAEISSLREFVTRKGSDDIVDIDGNNNNIKITKWQKEYIEKSAATVNEARAERMAEYQERAEKHKTDRGRWNTEATSYKPTKTFTGNQTMADLQYKLRQLRKERRSDYWATRDEIARQAYIGKLEQDFSSDDTKQIIKAIREMDINEFKEILMNDPDDFKTLYAPDEITTAQALIKLTEMYIKDEKVKQRLINKFEARIEALQGQ